MIHNYHAERYECGRRTSRKMHRQNSSIHSIYISIIFFCADRFWLNLLMSLFYSIAFIAHTPHHTTHTNRGNRTRTLLQRIFFSLFFLLLLSLYVMLLLLTNAFEIIFTSIKMLNISLRIKVFDQNFQFFGNSTSAITNHQIMEVY